MTKKNFCYQGHWESGQSLRWGLLNPVVMNWAMHQSTIHSYLFNYFLNALRIFTKGEFDLHVCCRTVFSELQYKIYIYIIWPYKSSTRAETLLGPELACFKLLRTELLFIYISGSYSVSCLFSIISSLKLRGRKSDALDICMSLWQTMDP